MTDSGQGTAEGSSVPDAVLTTPTVSPARAIWGTATPTTPWCPPEWQARLAAVLPAAFAVSPPGSTPPHEEASTMAFDQAAWRVIGATRRGRLHAHRGEHREDAVQGAQWSDGWCVAVADGAGSSAWSRIGSAMATSLLVESVRDACAASSVQERVPLGLRDILERALTRVVNAMRILADEVGEPWRAFRTTLLAVLVHEGQLATLQIGDGAIMLRSVHGTLEHPYAPAVGEYSGEVAHFLPDDGALEVGVASIREDDAATYDLAVLCTDGIEDPWYPLARHGAALIDEWMTGAASEHPSPAGYVRADIGEVITATAPNASCADALATWLTFEKRGENDDRTAAIAWRRRD